ncbi:sigma-70 family RNA polymerase sigma factor [[Flexibacter] sp. ATCC 35208]|uniref:sigma-70 family RNA polymerase sigma factor n=1 Tax=[Flexibacter] sp. ATCC 35208 TaxID=1936242 RepID=UPI0009C4A113|nr:sigma-70 family RNA polymerase sigma factor [[Flexibacter] sp. ATCC 35208]OMP77375.1 hypothetical protein BW716_20105 [[Flexibacter] sp. ATCC 35208]
MLHQLANIADHELMARARKLKDEEAAGILLERYSHLLAAVSLPSLNNYDNTPDEFFPSLLKRLFKSLHTQTIPKIGEWMQFFIKSQGNREARNTYYFPTSVSSDITRLENKVEKANTHLMQRKELALCMKTAFDELESPHREMLKEFYFDQKTFAEIAAEREYTMDKIRKLVRKAKQELALIILEKLEHAKVRPMEYAGLEEEIVEQQEAVRMVDENGKIEVVNREEVKKVDEHEKMKVVKRNKKVKMVAGNGKMEVMKIEEEMKVEYAKPVKSAKRGYAKAAKPKQDVQQPLTVEEYATTLEQPKPIKQEPALMLIVENPETQDYAKFRQQGQDIKDLQQGSLF